MKYIAFLTVCLFAVFVTSAQANWLTKVLGIDNAVDKVSGSVTTAAGRLDPLKIEEAKRDAVAIDRLKRGDDTISLRVSECLGTFALQAWLSKEPTKLPVRPEISNERKIWQIRISSLHDIGTRPTAPLPPDRKLLHGSKYDAAKNSYFQKRKKYRDSRKRWNQQFANHLKQKALVITPNLSEPGFYALRLVIVPEETEQDNWKISFTSDLTGQKKSQPFQVVSIERADKPNHPLGKPVSELLHFYAK
jgi:hypothetical protein